MVIARHVRPSSLAQAAGRLAAVASSPGPRTAPTAYHLPSHVTTSRTASRPAGPGGAGSSTSCQDSVIGASDGPMTGELDPLHAVVSKRTDPARSAAIRFIASRR